MNQQQEKSLIEKGVGFQKNLEFKKAEYCFSTALKSNPESIDALFNIANLYHQQGQLSRAIKTFEKVLEINPMHTDASISLSVYIMMSVSMKKLEVFLRERTKE